MALQNIITLLNRYIGLDVSSIGRTAIRLAVRKRMEACGIRDESEYARLLNGSRVELNNLVEDVVVSETWFFRDAQPFHFLSKRLGTALHLVNIHHTYRLLSVPCATGEEPYSIAMSLLNLGLSAERFHIDAVDISNRALNKAAQGVYTANSFRGSELSFRERFFRPVGNGYQIDDRVRKCVSFFQANVAEPGFLSGKDPYDVIFCRNLLIYLDLQSRKWALRSLEKALKPGGLLFVGHAEASAIPPTDFRAVGESGTFAFQKLAHRPSSTGLPRSHTALSPHTRNVNNGPGVGIRSPLAAHSVPTASDKAGSPPSVATPAQRPTLHHAARLADRGELSAAAAICEDLLRFEGPSADAYALLGIIREAENKLSEAEAYFDKAIYWDHNHVEALTHLSLLLERQGNKTRAASVRQHAARAAGGVR